MASLMYGVTYASVGLLLQCHSCSEQIKYNTKTEYCKRYSVQRKTKAVQVYVNEKSEIYSVITEVCAVPYICRYSAQGIQWHIVHIMKFRVY